MGARLDDAPKAVDLAEEPAAAKAKRVKKPRKTVEEAEQPADEMTAEEAGDAVAAWSGDTTDLVSDDGINDNLE